MCPVDILQPVFLEICPCQPDENFINKAYFCLIKFIQKSGAYIRIWLTPLKLN